MTTMANGDESSAEILHSFDVTLSKSLLLVRCVMNGSRSVPLMFNVVVYFCSSVAQRFSPKMNYRRMCVRLDL